MSNITPSFLDPRERHKIFEGLRLKIYSDILGVPTIGWGRNLRDRGISREEAEVLYANDYEQCRTDVLRALEAHSVALHTLTMPRVFVLEDMAFNMGYGGLMGFRNMWQALGARDYDRAAAEILDSAAARLLGRRYGELARIMRSGRFTA